MLVDPRLPLARIRSPPFNGAISRGDSLATPNSEGSFSRKLVLPQLNAAEIETNCPIGWLQDGTQMFG